VLISVKYRGPDLREFEVLAEHVALDVAYGPAVLTVVTNIVAQLLAGRPGDVDIRVDDQRYKLPEVWSGDTPTPRALPFHTG